MKTYIADIIPKIQEYSKRLDDLTLLTNHHWVLLNEINHEKKVFIFRKQNELLIATDGKVEKAKWEYLGNNSLIIDLGSETYLFKHGFFDENIFALKVDSKEEYAILINESKYSGEINSIEAVQEFLSEKYLVEFNPQKITTQTLDNCKYPIRYTKSGYSFKLGTYWEYIVEFSKGLKYRIYQKKSDNKFYILGKKDIIKFDDLGSCIYYLEKYGIYYNLMI